MRLMLASLVLMCGCSVLDAHEARKQMLTKEIEILQLEKRKALLQRQVELIENSDLVPVQPAVSPR